MSYDVALIHPPAIYDFRERTQFPGPLGFTVRESTDQFIIPSIGSLSIAEYLQRNGYKAIVDNIGERMVYDYMFDAEEYINSLVANIYAIELHWCVHSQGAIEIAKLCKRLHPESFVVLGGMTSTVFSEEIIRKYKFIDAVIRGEAEKAFLLLLKSLGGNGGLDKVPSITFRDSKGDIKANPLLEPGESLDEFEFTRLDLLQPQRSVYPPQTPPHWSIPICRGCAHNCVSCGGSAYSYNKYLGRKKPAFRSPRKILEDILKLNAQGVRVLFLFQDPHMAGADYIDELIDVLHDPDICLDRLTMELFGPPGEEYIKRLAKLRIPVNLIMSPESGSDIVRRFQGRDYSREKIFQTVEYCKKYGITLSLSTMIPLAKDTQDTIVDTWMMWEEICVRNNIKPPKGEASVFYAFGPMILLDPGSIGFDVSSKTGYRLLFHNLEEYIKGLSLPSWTQWVSYETEKLGRREIINMIIDSLECSINLRMKYGFLNAEEACQALNYYVRTSREVQSVIDQVLPP